MTLTERQAAYRLLGIPYGSDAQTVRKAWRALVRTYHPDLAKSDPAAANRKLVEINAAFDLISRSQPKQNKPRQKTAPRRQKTAQPMQRKTRAPLHVSSSGTAQATVGHPSLYVKRVAQPNWAAEATAYRGFGANRPYLGSTHQTAKQKVYA